MNWIVLKFDKYAQINLWFLLGAAFGLDSDFIYAKVEVFGLLNLPTVYTLWY